MSTPAESAELILRLFELRREKRMRKARRWFAAQAFRSIEDVVAAARGKDNDLFRMVLSYWDMTAALVNHGAIDAALFHDAGNEHVYVWAKLEPFLAEFRTRVGQPRYLAQLERMIAAMPDGHERVTTMQLRQRAALAAVVPETATLTGTQARN